MGDHNPYVGPASYQEDDRGRFFGRTDETRELTSLVIARRAVLLYAQSGAGKTSLLKAAVIPALKDRKKMQVSPVARVVGQDGILQPDGIRPNPYVVNALTAILGTAPTNPTLTLKQALAPLVASDPNATRRTPYLLVFDQFEEIFTWHPELYDDRAAFFQQLNDCLTEYPHVSLLLAMREDYLADIDSFAAYLPDRVRARMRLEQLQRDAAVAAVRQPAALAGKPFDPDVAEDLVDNLRRLGKYVEPVQLQIVCWQLWSRLPETATSITAADVQQYGNVDDALSKFYEDAVTAALKSSDSLSERTLRRWFGEQLITPAGTRGLVYQGTSDTAGLPNSAVTALDKRFIIRPVKRGHDTWYELAHDRLVQTVLEDNRKWLADYRNPVADAHQRWLTAGRDPAKLLNGNQLADAKSYATAHPLDITAEEGQFLTTSDAEAKRARKRRRIIWAVAIATGLILAGLSVATTFALKDAKQSLSRTMVQDIWRDAQDKPHTTLGLASQALEENPGSNEARMWISSLLLNQAFWMPGPAMNTAAVFTGSAQRIRSLAFSPDGRNIAGAWANSIVVWDAANGQVLGKPMQQNTRTDFVVFSPDGRRLVTDESAGARVWNIASGTALAWHPMLNSVFAQFAPDSQKLVTVASTGFADIWEAETGKVIHTVGDGSRMYTAAFTPDGQQLITYSLGAISHWDVQSGARVGPRIQVPPGVSFAAFSADASRVLEVHPNWTMSVLDAATGQAIVRSIPVHGSVESASFSRDGRFLLAAPAGSDKSVRVWDANTGQLVGIVIEEPNKIYAYAFSPDAASVVTSSDTSGVRVWRTVSGKPLRTPGPDRTYEPAVKPAKNTIDIHDATVNVLAISGFSVAFSPDGQRIVAITADQGAQIWDTESGRPLGSPFHDENGFTSVTFNCDGSRVLTASKGGAELWDAATGRQLKRFGDELFFTAAYDHDCSSIIVSAANRLRVWDAQTGRNSGNHPVAEGPVFAASFSPDGKIMVATSSAGKTIVQRRGTRAPAETIDTMGAAIHSIFYPDGNGVLITDSQAAQTWWIGQVGSPADSSAQPGRRLEHAGLVNSAAFGKFGEGFLWVATACWDKTARVWEAGSGLPLGLPMIHPAAVLGVAVRPGGRQIATLAKDGIVRLWTVVLGNETRKEVDALVSAARDLGVSNNDRARAIEKLRAQVAAAPPGDGSALSQLRKMFGLDH